MINHHIAFNNLRKKWKGTNIENLYFTSNREDFTLQHDSIIGLAFLILLMVIFLLVLRTKAILLKFLVFQKMKILQS